jgi:L-alanine-DL-glutamate epimerase-like enolase superfamily enzyme
MRVSWVSYRLELRTPLRISRSTMAGRDAMRVTVTDDDGLTGHGEVVSSVYLGMAAGVRAAYDAALHDLRGKQFGEPVHRLLDLPDPTPVATAYTIGLVDPDLVGVPAAFSVLKVKAGDEHDVDRIAAVRRAAPDARLLIDPNGGWTPEQTLRRLEELARHRIEMVEQPIPPGTPDRLAWISERTDVPIVADEDAATEADVDRLAGAVAGINIKLAKCGGIAPALRLATKARAAGMEIMLGCLVASTLGIAPAVHLAGLARWVDLDGHLLLADDPYAGIGGDDGFLRLTDAPGLGVQRRGVR